MSTIYQLMLSKNSSQFNCPLKELSSQHLESKIMNNSLILLTKNLVAQSSTTALGREMQLNMWEEKLEI